MIKKCNGKNEIILRIIKRRTSMKLKELLLEAEKRNIEGKMAREVVSSLIGSGRLYQPSRGVIELVEI